MREFPPNITTISDLVLHIAITSMPFYMEDELIIYLKEYSNSIYYNCYIPSDTERTSYIFKIKTGNGSFIYLEFYTSVVEYMEKHPTSTTELVNVKVGGIAHKNSFHNSNMYFAKEALRFNLLCVNINGLNQTPRFINEWCATLESIPADE
jgi:hypothetical protein